MAVGLDLGPFGGSAGGFRGRLLLGLCRGWIGATETRAARHEVRDVVAGEFGQLVMLARLRPDEQADDERAVLLEEEDVARLLLVHVPADDAEGRLVVSTG